MRLSVSARMRPSNRRADQEILLAGITTKQCLEGREEGHVECRALLSDTTVEGDPLTSFGM